MSLAVCDASPLIALEQIEQLSILEKLFPEATLVVPPAVAREIAPTVTLPDWIELRVPSEAIGPRILGASLGAGESETLSLALEVEARWTVLDERPARRLAQTLGLQVVGTLGILLTAKNRGLLSAVRPCLDALIEQDFRVAPALYEMVLEDAGELE